MTTAPYKISMWVIALLLMIKAGFMAFYMTPAADIPDESGHYAYVNDISNGDFFPILGRATIPNDLWREGNSEHSQRENYIAQHPPLYYAVAAIPLAIGKALEADKQTLGRLPRLISAVSLGLLVMVLFHTQLATGLSARWALITSPTIAFVPMVSHLSSGITNDVFLFLMCAAATLYLVRFLQSQKAGDAYLCAFWLAMAGATKMTAWILVLAMVAILVFELRGTLKEWLLKAAAIGFIAFSAPLWWILRNIYYHGDPLKISLVPNTGKVGYYPLSQLLTEQPLVDWLFHHFYGLIGFSGYCQNAELAHLCLGARITRIEGFPIFFFSLVTGACAFALVAFACRILLRKVDTPSLPNRSVREGVAAFATSRLPATAMRATLAIAGIGVFALVAGNLQWTPDTIGLIALLSLAGLFAIPFWSAMSLSHDSEQGERLVFYSTAILAASIFLIFNQAHKAYLITGMLKGVQGRYLYPFLPLLAAAGGYVLHKWWPLRLIVLPAVLVLLYNDTSALIEQIIPFYLLVRV